MMNEEDEHEVLILQPVGQDDGYGVRESEDDNANDGDVRTLTIDEAINETGFGRFHVLIAVMLGWSNSADAIEMLSVSFILPQASCELKATDLQLGFLTAVGFAGMMIGAYFWCSVSDLKGRIKIIMLCQACNGLFIVGSSLSQNLWFLIFMRLLSGFGIGGTSPLMYIYLVEIMPSSHRGRMTAVLSCFFMGGQLLVAGLAWFILPHTEWTWSVSGFTFNSWRIFLLLSSFPVISSMFLFMLFPESPRYLVQVNRISEAKAVLRFVYRKNGHTKPYDDNYTIVRHGQVEERGGFCYTIKKVARNSWSVVTLPNIRYNFLYSSTIYVCLSFSYYGLTMWFPTLFTRMDAANATSVCEAALLTPNTTNTICDNSDQSEVYFDTFLQAMSSLPGHLFYFLVIDRMGGRMLTGVSMMLTAVSVFFIWFISSKIGSIVMSCVFSGITIVSWNAIGLLSTEIYPTKLRSTASGLQSALANRASAIIASVTFGALITTHCAVPILLIVCLLALGSIVTCKLPNLKNADIN